VDGIVERISALVGPVAALVRSIAGAVGLVRKTAKDPGDPGDQREPGSGPE
jgi:hypothetical protein